MKIAIIGSGLAAVSAAKSLIAREVKPIVLDVGEKLDPRRSATIKKISSVDPEQWSDDERNLIASNPTIHNKDSFPQKLAFGSDYFYGQSTESAPVESTGGFPPFSYAKGGFSVGWGASVLPPDDCDLNGWPVKNDKLNKHYKEVLSNLPYAAKSDGLNKNFPLINSNYKSLPLTQGNKSLLVDLVNSGLLAKDRVVFGQSRLLVRVSDEDNGVGCKHCGYCMSGCVYGCIYKSSQDIDRMLANNSIEYVPGVLVQSVQETKKMVKVAFTSKNGTHEALTFNRVFLAAGALNSTRIILKSKQLYEQKVLLKSTVGFVAPMLRIKRSPINWPNTNTQPGIFLEYKVPNFSNHWVHTQLSTPNEMVLKKLNISPTANGFIQNVKKYLAGHLMVALCNIHSDHSNGYELELKKSLVDDNDKLVSNRQKINEPYQAIKKASRQLFSIGRKISCYPITPFIQNSINTGGYHVGGSLPMKITPEKETDTNLLGNPKGCKRIHVVDSSVFPSIPGTTIGLLAMANAARIVSEVDLLNK